MREKGRRMGKQQGGREGGGVYTWVGEEGRKLEAGGGGGREKG